MTQAEAGIEELKTKVDSLVIIPNERLKHATDQKITFANAFEIADDVLRQAVQSISDLIRDTGFINLDFADVTAIMKDAGLAHMGVGRAAGKNKAEEAARMAISVPRCWRPPSTVRTECSSTSRARWTSASTRSSRQRPSCRRLCIPMRSRSSARRSMRRSTTRSASPSSPRA